MHTIQDSILAFRKSKDAKQEDFAAKIGISRVTLSNIERGGHVSEETVTKVCKAFDITKDELVRYGVNTPVKSENPWENALIKQLKTENENLKDMIEFLKTLIISPTRENFQKLLSYAGASDEQTDVQLRSPLRRAA